LINGPCGGTRDGKCEINEAKKCVWSMVIPKITRRRLPVSQIIDEIKDYSAVMA